MKINSIELNDEKFPKHIGIIMDGNSRWAAQHNYSRSKGHRAGFQALKKIMKTIEKTPIEIISIYAFSKENWKRSEKELKGLFNLLRQFYRSEYPNLKKRNIRILHSGDYEDLESDIIDILNEMTTDTKNNTGKTLNLALNYSGRNEIVRVMRKIASEGYEPGEINEELINKYFDNPEISDIDLLIRTSGEMRISNFFLWQLAYSELYFTKTLWPDFDDNDLAMAIQAFQIRERRFGGRKKAPAQRS